MQAMSQDEHHWDVFSAEVQGRSSNGGRSPGAAPSLCTGRGFSLPPWALAAALLRGSFAA